jgi:dTDP-glucose 4,6-dehydratase
MQSNNFEPKYISVDEFLESKCNLQREQTTNFYVFGATPTTNLPNNLMTVERYFRQIMEKVTDFDNPPVFMNLSSGAVYRNAFGHQRFLFEDDEMQLAGKGINLYQDCKISIENLLTDKTKAGSIRGVNPRLFTFAGPGFPLNSHFAVSNFIMSCLNENEVCIAGHPKTSRSYMDPVDMVSWLLKLLRKQEEVGIEPVHIGSDSSIYMDELAEKIRKIFGGKSIRNTQIESAIPNSYVPSTIKTREMLGVTYNWNLDKTLVKWHDYINANRQIKESFWE